MPFSNANTNNLKTRMHFLIIISECLKSHSSHRCPQPLLAIMMVLEFPPRLSFSSQVRTESL